MPAFSARPDAPPWLDRRRLGRLVGLAAVALLLGPSFARAQEGPSEAEEPATSKRLKRIDQDDLLKGRHPLRQVVENGRHLFSTPFTKLEGYGEGGRPDGKGGFDIGPREQMFRDKLEEFRVATHSTLTGDELRGFLNFPKPDVNANTGKVVFPYMRLNGLDSQSCFECHNSIGSARLSDTRSHALTRKQSTVGGPAGFASTAFINDDLPKTIFKFVRNPPHVFGTGYAQELAEEMTIKLHVERALAVKQALHTPSQKVSRPLKAKGTDFGMFVVTYTGDPMNKPALKTVLEQMNEQPQSDPAGFTVERDKIQGVSVDLVVRPFQWKGIASNERNFVRDALQFHFGMEAREKNMNFGTSSEDHDHDSDGVADELTIGDVSALTIFTMTIRPPSEARALADAERRKEDRGRKIFEGLVGVSKANSCSSCHTPSLRIHDSTVVVRDPLREVEKHGPEQFASNRTGLSAPLKNSAQLPIVRQIRDLDLASVVAENDGDNAVEAVLQKRADYERSVMEAKDRRADGYAFDLTNLQPANIDPGANAEHSDPMSQSLPRLPADGKKVDVPLFSDLKRHKMGDGLKERPGFLQKTDADIPVAEDEFLTRPLWGVGDTGPWLHDGRAQSLREAILLHESNGSEANPIIQAFRGLTQEDQDAVVSFLLTLRLPLDPRYAFDDFH